MLFCIANADITLETDKICPSGYLIGGHLISNLNYVAIINNYNFRTKLQEYLNILTKTIDKFGLQINAYKTKCLTTNKTIKVLDIYINEKQIEQVREFVYHGHKLASDNNSQTAVQHRIGLGWAAFE